MIKTKYILIMSWCCQDQLKERNSLQISEYVNYKFKQHKLLRSTISKPKTGDQVIIIKSCQGFPDNSYCLLVGIQTTSNVM